MFANASFNKLTVLAVCATLFGLLDVSMSSAIAQGKSQSKTAPVRTKVKVYFYHDPDEYMISPPLPRADTEPRAINALTHGLAGSDFDDTHLTVLGTTNRDCVADVLSVE